MATTLPIALALVSEGPLWVTRLVNRVFAGPANALLEKLGIHPHDPHLPIPDYIALQIMVALIIVALFLFLRSRLSLERPGNLQQGLEVAVEFMREQAHEIAGHHGKHFVPMVLT